MSESSADSRIQEQASELPDDTPIDLQQALRSSHVHEVLDKLETELVGLIPVKTRIRETAALLLVDRVRKKLGLSSETPTLHMSFTGNPEPVRPPWPCV
jgi:hypothetical protein